MSIEKISIDEVKKILHTESRKHHAKFGYAFTPPVEVLRCEKKAVEEYRDLIEQSVSDGIDRIPERYGVDVKQLMGSSPDVMID